MVIFPAIISGVGANFYTQGISVFFKDIAAELRLSRAATSLVASIGNLEGGVLAPVTGFLTDKYGPKWLVMIGLCIFIVGLLFMYFISVPWHYYVAWGVLMGLGLNLGLTIAQDKVLTNWFIGKRGLAIGTRFAIIGVCGMIVVPVVTWISGDYGWRITCLIWAGLMALSLVFAWFFTKQERPEYYGLLPDGATRETLTTTDQAAMISEGLEYARSFDENEYTLKQSMKTPAFWIIVIAWAGTMLVYGGVNIHLVPFLTDNGISRTQAGFMMSVMIFATIPSRFLGGLLTDYFRKDRLKFIMAAALFIQGIGIASFIVFQNLAAAYFFLICFGFGNGSVTPIRLAIGARFFGRKSFTSILGIMMLFISPVSMLAPIYSGWTYDTTGSYISAFTVLTAVLFVTGFLMLFLRAPENPGYRHSYGSTGTP